VAFETAWRHDVLRKDELIKDVLRKDGLRKIDREIKFEKFE
jgi:phenylalanyl-tRNA synthetase beta subunit